MTEKITFTSKTGELLTGELVLPQGADKAPAVVLIQEWWGVNDHIRSLLERLAAAGFIALAPDLYHGQVTRDAEEAGRLMTALDKPRALGEIAAAVQHVTTLPRSNGRVGVMGFCMGGAFAFAAAATVPELGAVVPFYGIPTPAPDYTTVRAPVLAHFAARDEWAKASDADQLKRQLESLGKSMELHVYDANHAFMNDTRPEVYHPEAAKLAWDRSLEFLRTHLG
ncbi:protein usf [Chondromyces crocatus]|uniref:Protein usf n=2 Tax=Chondromyces crocatus TaxID=52 RepID=A0A0K1E4X7_CHOCO|nr:protein usf [Chondromyces crocatus]